MTATFLTIAALRMAAPGAIELPPPAPPIFIFAAAPAVPPPLLTPDRPPDAPPQVPAPVLAVIEAAVDSGDPAAVAAVITFTKAANPATADRIDAIHTRYKERIAAREARQAADRRAALLAAGPFDYWSGSIEFGASRATGNSDTLALYGAFRLERAGVFWTQKLNARIDYQRTNDATTTDRVLAAWQPQRRFGDRLYAYGLAQYESDRFVGFDSRYTLGGGIGYSVLRDKNVSLDLEGGPAVRHIDFTDDGGTSNVAGRASLAFRWKVGPTFNVTQDAALFLERGSTNATTTTALDTRLFGPLKARLSYNIVYEPDTVARARALDTVSRATLVVGF